MSVWLGMQTKWVSGSPIDRLKDIRLGRRGRDFNTSC